MTIPTQWLRQIEEVCAIVDIQHVDLLLDQTAWDNCAVPALRHMQPEAPWFSLFSGMPEENLLDQAPLLMRLNLTYWQHKAWLEELLENCATDARLLVVISPLSFEVLSQALQTLSHVQWGGQSCLLRFYDPRIFPVLMGSILSDEQRARYLQLVSYWGWLDRDHQTQWLTGTYPAGQGNGLPAVQAINDEQYDLIGCIADAQKLLVSGKFSGLDESSEQRFALLYERVVQASRENYFGGLSEYVQQKF